MLAILAQPASAVHDSYFTPSRFNVPGQPLPNYVVYDSNNIGATSPEPGVPAPPGDDEADRCFANDNPSVQIFYAQTVWHEFSPHLMGDVTIRARPLGPPGFSPVPVIMRFDSVAGHLDYANAECEVVGVNQFAQPRTVRVQPGSTWKVQLGGRVFMGGTITEGNYRIELFYDPDSDGDTVLDSRDQCPEPGRPDLSGCTPDQDGDGLRDFLDACDLTPIPPGVSDGPPRNGCPDLQRVSAQPKFDWSATFFRLNRRRTAYVKAGVKRPVVSLKGLTAGTRVSLSCTQGGCKGDKRTAKSSKRLVLLRKARLRKGVKLILRATRPGWVGRYFELKVTKSKIASRFDRERCTRPGSRKPVLCSAISLIR